MGFTLTPHTRVKSVNETGQSVTRIVAEKPYIRLVTRGEPAVYLQAGAFWTEGGEQLRSVPEWVKEQLARIDDAALAVVGLTPVRTETASAAVPEPASATVTPFKRKRGRPRRKVDNGESSSQ